MKKILVTGCNGQLGKAIQKEYESEAAELILTDVADLDITDNAQVLQFVREHKPQVIMNCAAHTAVDLCEEQWDLADQRHRTEKSGDRSHADGCKAYAYFH